MTFMVSRCLAANTSSCARPGLVAGMLAHLDVPVVQLSALLCLVPLALNNTRLQVEVAGSCLPAILIAMQRHLGEVEVVSKAMIMLGVLGQVGARCTPLVASLHSKAPACHQSRDLVPPMA